MGRDRILLPRLGIVGCLTLTCLITLFVLSRSAVAQVDEGAITGTVQDSTGAVVPNAQVTLVNTDQGITMETKSNGSGGYTFSPVRIGHYEITVTAQGFSKTTQKNITVQVAQVVQANITLKLGAATETVEVTTAPPVLQTEEASVGQVIGSQEVNDLPLNGRNFTFLAQLGAGMQTPQADTRGNAASGAFSANGLRPSQNNYLIDGIDNNSNTVDFLNGTNYIILPPVDAIQEFKVQTADFSAELGRAGGAVLNATIKSGTNSIHGAAWEFIRNDKLDAADYFENNNGVKKGELRQNQFGFDLGGPIIKNKVFLFGDYEGFRRVQGSPEQGNVPTALMRSSGYTDLTDILALNSGSRTDALGRTIPSGTILDPATTRFVANGAVDPVSGLVNNSKADAYVRDPFGTCGASTTNFTTSCGLNQLPTNRIDPNAVNVLNLYPAPNSGLNTFSRSPGLYEHRNQFDIRGDFNPSDKNQMFLRFSYADDPIFIPGIFGGIADGGSFDQGLQSAKSQQAVLGFTHEFSPNVTDQLRIGFAHLHTSRFGPEATVAGLPGKYGINGGSNGNGNIPQPPSPGIENGGIPQFGIGNLANLGSNNFLPSDEFSKTIQVTDDFTRIYGKHSFKMGIEYQNVAFATLQPAWSHGEFDYGGGFTDIPNQSGTTGGVGQMVLTPTAFAAGGGAFTSANTPGGFDYSGGANSVFASNINKTYDQRIYFATYFQDDWKVTPKLTLNLGVRWDYFGPINEYNGGQANFVPYPIPSRAIGGPTFLIPATGKDNRVLSTTFGTNGCRALSGIPDCIGFEDLLHDDGITLDQTNRYGNGLVQTQKDNFSPRVGFAWQATPKWVVRSGFGLFFNAFENQGYGPNIGENYPFVYNLQYFSGKTRPTDPGISSQVSPISYSSPFANCPSAAGNPGTGHGTADFESGFTCIPLTSAALDARGLGLYGMQFDYQTPRTYSGNFTLQYSITRSLAAQAAYVYTHSSGLQTNVGTQNVTQLLPAGISTSNCGAAFAVFPAAVGNTSGSCIPWPDFGGGDFAANYGQSTYHGLQTKLEEQFSNGLTFLLTYTWSKALSDAGDLLNGGATNSGSASGPYRALNIPGLGPKFDWGPANFDVRNVLHFSGGYQLPFGKGMQYMNTGGIANAVLGGWAVNWIVTAQGGQPLDFGCPNGTASGAGCVSLLVPGQDQHKNIKLKLPTSTDTRRRPFWIDNDKAFNQPCQLGGSDPASLAPIPGSPHGKLPDGSDWTCVPLAGAGALGSKPGNTVGPPVKRFDFSVFKKFPIGERLSTEFRAEFFNILNHPNFNPPNFGGNGVNPVGGSGNFTDPHFGEIAATRFNPYDPREIQFALKIYY
jgi:hypothetical protein